MAPIGLWAGALVLSGLAAAALLLTRRRDAALAIVGALILAAVLIAADNWDTARFEELRSSPAAVIAAVSRRLAGYKQRPRNQRCHNGQYSKSRSFHDAALLVLAALSLT